MKFTYLLCAFLLGLALQAQDTTQEQLEAEGFFVLDNKVLDLYLREENYDVQKAKASLKMDVELFLSDVNEYFKTMEEYGVNIRISIADVQYLSFDINSVVSYPDMIDNDITISTFSTFLQGHHPKGQPSRYDDDYDFAMFLTGYDIVGSSDGLNGYARVKAVCLQGEAFGIAEWSGAIPSTQLFAHEIGHILGCLHDPVDAVTVMVPSRFPSTNLDKYKFSKKSADEVKAHIQYLASRGISNCMKVPSKSGSRMPTVTPETYTGRGQDPETICQRSVYPESSPCTSPGFWKNDDGSHKSSFTGDDVCLTMFCHQNNTGNECFNIRPMEGMRCDVGKSCRKGLCVNDPRPAYQNVNAHCLFGDDKDPKIGTGFSCEHQISTMRMGAQECLGFFGKTCCETCPKYQTGDPSCPYGDANEVWFNDGSKKSCADVLKEHGGAEDACEGAFYSECCQTCNNRKAERGAGPNCKYGDDDTVHFNNEHVSCGAVIEEWGYTFVCETDGYLKTRCCGSCQKRHEEKGAGPNCKYGDDKFLNFDNEKTTCDAMIAKWGHQYACESDSYLMTRCCGSCQNN